MYAQEFLQRRCAVGSLTVLHMQVMEPSTILGALVGGYINKVGTF